MICSDISAVLSAKAVVLGWGFFPKRPAQLIAATVVCLDGAIPLFSLSAGEEAATTAWAVWWADEGQEAFALLDEFNAHSAIRTWLQHDPVICAQIELVHCIDLREVS